MNTTKDVNVMFYLSENDESETKDYFTLQEDDSFMYHIMSEIDKKNDFYEKEALINELIDNYIIKKKENPKKALYNLHKMNEVVLYNKETILNKERYIIRTDEPYLVHSFVSHPTSYIDHLKTLQHTSNIIDKANYATVPFYSILYNSKQYNINNNKPIKELLNINKYVYYENQTNSFEKYISKIVPTLNTYIETGIDQLYIKPFSILIFTL
jgi:hypothetical protein